MKIRCVFLLSLVSLSAGVSAKAPDYTFVIDPQQSNVEISITIMQKTSTDSTPLSGEIEAEANPNFSPFGTINITGLDIAATETLNFSWYVPILLDGSATVSDYGMTMTEHGSEVVVSSDSFTQPNNFMQSRGVIDYSFVSPLMGSFAGTTDMAAESEPTEQAVAGRISQNGSEVTLEADIYYEDVLMMDTMEVPVLVTGTVIAHAPARWVDEDLDSSLTVDVVDLEIMAAEWLCRDLVSDLDGSGFVDLQDFARLTDFSEFVTLASEWLQPSQVLWADTNQDRVTDLADLARLGSYWLQSAPW